jgi:two-component system, OmpR family, sensor kinase
VRCIGGDDRAPRRHCAGRPHRYDRPAMIQPNRVSIRARFARAFLFVIAVTIVVGSFGIWRLSDYRSYSDDLRDVYFRSTEYIGDLNNYTSDFRADEGALLLADRAADTQMIRLDMVALDQRIGLAWRSYRAIAHEPQGVEAETLFWQRWTAYRAGVDQVLAEEAAGHHDLAKAFYLGASRRDYEAASDALGDLTSLNVRNAAMAARHADRAFRQTRLVNLAAMIFAAVMVSGALFYIRRQIADPLVDLADVMHGLAHDDMDVAIQGRERHDEIGAMARAVEVFRRNAIDLALSQKALAEHASMLTDELAKEQRLTQMQRNFLAMASHEFRTPLASIDGHAQRLLSKASQASSEDLGEDMGNRARAIRRAVKRITSVVEHLIDHARLADMGPQGVFAPDEIDLAEILHEVCAQHRELVPNAFIHEQFGRAPLPITGDRKLLQLLFGNLVDNAIKYSRDRILVSIGVERSADHVVVTVSDQGIGIPEAEIDHVFERFFRGGNTGATVGTGIGLFLVQAVIDLHHGSISLASREGQGTRIAVRLAIGH